MSNQLAGIFMLLAVVITSASAGEDKQPRFKITTKRDNDRVEIRADNDKTMFIIHSPSGISHAVIKRTDENWPDALKLRLCLKGLEHFLVTNDKVKLQASVSSQDTKVRLWKAGIEDSPLAAKSRYWIDVRMVGCDGKPAKTIPLKDGYFELTLPKAFFEGNPNSVKMTWIDFYRN